MASADIDLTARPYAQDPSAPEAHGPRPGGNAAPPTRDDLDDLFNYDPQIGDTFQDAEGNNDAAKVGERRRDTTGVNEDLGIDEEIKIRKPRKPTVKLDEDKLLSQNGIHKLRRISKERLRFRGKGHEFSDVQRLLNTYQLWLDDLFPKAKFADGLAIIEKLGHKKRVKVMRQEWINEEKPKPEDDGLSDVDGDLNMFNADDSRPTEELQAANDAQSERNASNGDARVLAQGNDADDSGDETLYRRPTSPPDADPPHANETQWNDGPKEDELDELLAENAARQLPASNNRPIEADNDDFADEEEAMAGMW